MKDEIRMALAHLKEAEMWLRPRTDLKPATVNTIADCEIAAAATRFAWAKDVLETYGPNVAMIG